MSLFVVSALSLHAQPQGAAQIGPLTRTTREPIGQPRIELRRLPFPLPTGFPIPRPGPACVAPVDVNVNVPRIGLKLRTEEPAVWYSLVESIPPVGHTASITTKAVRLVDGDRVVGSLVSGEVAFREVVRDVSLGGSAGDNEQRLRSLLADMSRTSPAQLNVLRAIPIEERVVPGAGVQVMRAELDETYEIEGVGRDTVRLSGWIAVRHGEAKAALGEAEVTWDTAVLDTEFVGLDLRGDSKVFGPVHVTLDTSRPARGQVGRIQIPELARFALLAKLKREQYASATIPSSGRPQPLSTTVWQGTH